MKPPNLFIFLFFFILMHSKHSIHFLICFHSTYSCSLLYCTWDFSRRCVSFLCPEHSPRRFLVSVVSFQTFEEPGRTKSLLLRNKTWERLRHLVNHKRSLLACSLPQTLSLHRLTSPCLLQAPCHVPPVCGPYRGVCITSVQLAPWRLSLVSKLGIIIWIRIILPQQTEADLVKRSWPSPWSIATLCGKQWYFCTAFHGTQWWTDFGSRTWTATMT